MEQNENLALEKILTGEIAVPGVKAEALTGLAQMNLADLHTVGPQAVAAIRDYFRNADSSDKKADFALRTLGRINGAQGSYLKMLALRLQGAKMRGLKGAELDPILADLGLKPPASGPAARETQEPLAAMPVTV